MGVEYVDLSQPGPAPLFSIVVVHFQGVNSHKILCRGIDSLRAQTFRDFEILAYHDGPLLDTDVEMPVPIACTPERHNDWGHSLRDRGIREATGEYILHFNADNVLFPNALAEITKEIARPPRVFVNAVPQDTNDVIVFPVIVYGLQKVHNLNVFFKDDQSFYTILNGNPPLLHSVDCMQFVMKRELWLQEGGWFDKRPEGDGHMYEAFAKKYGYRTVGPILGAHY